jgi:hypothetical protein
VLEIEDKYRSSFTAHGAEDAALAEAAEHARDYWADVAPSHPEMPPTPDGLDDAEAVRSYFANCGREHYYIHELEIEGALEAVVEFLTRLTLAAADAARGRFPAG